MKPNNKLMKHVCQAALVGLLATLSNCACNTVLTQSFSQEKIIHYSQLKTLGETADPNEYVVYVNKGDTIPLALSMDTDFMEFKQDHVDLVAKQKLYFRVKTPKNLSAAEMEKLSHLDARSISEMSSEQRAELLREYMLYVSRDAVHWAPLYGSKAYREVLGFKEGSFSFGVMASDTKGVGVSLDIRTVK